MAPRKKQPIKSKQPTINEDGRVNITQNQLDEMTLNYAFNRLQYLQSLVDPNKDIYSDCGYPKPGTINAETFKEMFEREAGNRVVTLEPKECWKITPLIYEVEDEDIETPFELAWKELIENFGGVNFFQNDEGSSVFSHLYRADVVSGIGRYGILLMGFDDGLDLEEPIPEIVQAVEQGSFAKAPVQRKLLYLQSYDETQAIIESLETNPKSRRYGLPLYYNLTVTEELTMTTTQNTVKVHWSRVIHIADNKTSSEVIGTPRQEPVFNRLLDLRKLYAGSGEMYYRGAFPGLALENLPGYTGTIDTEAAKEQMFNYTNSLQRWLAISGISAKSLSVQVASPKDQIDCQIEAICIIKEIPLRIFKGSERGELASTTDKDSWEERIDARRNSHVTPSIIVPFVNVLIITGVLPVPSEGLKVSWRTDKPLNPITQATVIKTTTEAIANYVNSNSRSLITPFNFFTKIMKLSAKEAESLIEDAMEEEDDLEEDVEDVDQELEEDVEEIDSEDVEEPEVMNETEDEYGTYQLVTNAQKNQAKLEGKKLNKPFRTPQGPKKFGVYVKNEKGNVVLVRFGDPNMEIKRDNLARRNNFRARHNCDNPGPKWKPRYWACKTWSNKPVSEIVSE